MSEDGGGRVRRWRERVRRLRAAVPARPRPTGYPRPPRAARRQAVTGVPTLDALLNPPPEEAGAEPADADTRPPGATADDPDVAAETSDGASTLGPDTGRPERRRGRFGAPGQPINRSNPFYVGFVGAIGVLVAWGLVNLLGAMSSVLTLVVISLFLALGLDPVVAWMQGRGVPRGAAIALVFLGLLAVFAAFMSSVIPPVVDQASEIAANAPQYVEQVSQYLQRSEWLNELDQQYGVTDRVLSELNSVLASGQTVTTVFGGIFGAGRAVVSGVASTVTVLVLTLYFLASLNGMKSMAYALVPASRRRRVQLLGDEITRRIGGFVSGQLLLAAINGLLSWIVLSVMGIPYAEVLAFTVGLLGVVPLVGATLGAVIVVIAALFTSFTSALILTAYYIAYQQFENYVLAPRVMARTVSAPGGVILVAALAGGSLLGIVGALIAIPLAAGLLLIVEEVVIPQQNRA